MNPSNVLGYGFFFRHRIKSGWNIKNGNADCIGINGKTYFVIRKLICIIDRAINIHPFHWSPRCQRTEQTNRAKHLDYLPTYNFVWLIIILKIPMSWFLLVPNNTTKNPKYLSWAPLHSTLPDFPFYIMKWNGMKRIFPKIVFSLGKFWNGMRMGSGLCIR